MATQLSNLPKISTKYYGQRTRVELSASNVGLSLEGSDWTEAIPFSEITSIDVEVGKKGRPILHLASGESWFSLEVQADSLNEFQEWVDAIPVIWSKHLSDLTKAKRKAPVVIQLTIIDGGGWSPSIGSQVDLSLTSSSMKMIGEAGRGKTITVPFSELVEVEIDMHQSKRGGGFFGGGFGLQGAAEGMFEASVLNYLTTKFTSWYVLSIKGNSGWTIGAFGQDVSRSSKSDSGLLEIKSSLRPLMDAVAKNQSRKTSRKGVTSDSVVDELARLAELKSSGMITDNEFKLAKNKILGI
jgi:hypothetical protein